MSSHFPDCSGLIKGGAWPGNSRTTPSSIALYKPSTQFKVLAGVAI